MPRQSSHVENDVAESTSAPVDDALATQSPRDLLNADTQLMPGTFWMDIDNAAQYFESIYLNWDPALFTHRQDLHFAWDLSQNATRGSHASLQHNPQLSVGATAGGTIWLLLCRHLQNTPASEGHHSIDLSGFVALSAYAAHGRTIRLAGRPYAKSNFVDSPQILLKMQDCLPSTCYTVLPLEQELLPHLQTFTISAFSNSELSLDWAAPAHPHSTKCSGSWTKDSAGGNATGLAYGKNPQFTVKISRATKLSILLETSNEALNVHVKLVHGQGKRIRGVRKRDILFDSSDYRRRSCVADSKGTVEAGVYTMVCSTFEPQQFGNFDVLLESDEPTTVTPLPREDAGRLQMTTTAYFPTRATKIGTKLLPKRLANVYMALRRSTTSTRIGSIPMRLSIEQGYGAQRRLLKTSPTGGNDIEPARLDEFDLSPEMLQHGDLWVVAERTCIVDQAAELSMDLLCFINQPDAIELGSWVVLED